MKKKLSETQVFALYLLKQTGAVLRRDLTRAGVRRQYYHEKVYTTFSPILGHIDIPWSTAEFLVKNGFVVLNATKSSDGVQSNIYDRAPKSPKAAERWRKKISMEIALGTSSAYEAEYILNPNLQITIDATAEL